MVQGLYGLWLARNEARDGRRIAEPHEIASSVMHYIHEWQTVQEAKVSGAPKQVVTEQWHPPETGWWKANADGASSKLGIDPHCNSAIGCRNCYFSGA